MTVAMIVLTSAGIDALVDAQNGVTTAIEITEVGLSDAAFIAAPTLTALPHEFKRIGAVSGEVVSQNMIHMGARDFSDDIYTGYGFGLFLADGTLFGTYSQVTPLVHKVSIAQFLIAIDLAFQTSIAAAITFGNVSFLNPPATETIAGVAKIATNALADAGANDATIMSPKKVKRVLDALATAVAATIAAFTAAEAAARAAYQAAETAARTAFEAVVNAAIAALQARTITGGGLASGGGDLTADRVITVTAATSAELQAATTADKVPTPAAFGGLPRVRGSSGYEVFPGGTLVQRGQNRSGISAQGSVSLTFPIAFADTDYTLTLSTVIPGVGDYDDFMQEIAGTRSTTGVTLYAQDPSSGGSSSLSGFDWRAEGKA